MTMGVFATKQSMYGRVYTCFVQLGLSQNLDQEKQGGGGTLKMDATLLCVFRFAVFLVYLFNCVQCTVFFDRDIKVIFFLIVSQFKLEMILFFRHSFYKREIP